MAQERAHDKTSRGATVLDEAGSPIWRCSVVR
jgi:hypothetical protein